MTTPFDMTVLNDMDRFHLVLDTLHRLPDLGPEAPLLKERLESKLIEHKQYIRTAENPSDQHALSQAERAIQRWDNEGGEIL